MLSNAVLMTALLQVVDTLTVESEMGVNVSQSVFAIYLNTTVSTVRQWERGDKKPGGIAARMLQLVQKNGLEISG